MNTLDYARFYTARNWQVFPCKPHDKTPLVKWSDVATTDERQIQEWWREYPDANIGIATGARSGNVVLDIDANHGGEESMIVLSRQFGALPTTPQAKTGGGGRHIIFSHPGREVRNSASKIAAGIDVRGDGGYIVAAPSVHPNGNIYQWAKEYPPSRTPLAPIPEWLLEKMTAQQVLEYPQTPAAPEYQQRAGDAIATGSRNQILTSLAGTMRRRGMGEEAIYNALLAENKNKCIPALAVNEVAAIAKSVCRYTATAAPAMQGRERIQTEWAFAKVIFDFPEIAQDFLWVDPSQFGDENIRHFWEAVIEGHPVTKAAEQSGLLPDLEYIVAGANNIDIYARQIARYDYLAGVSRTAGDIQALAARGESEKVLQLIDALYDSKQVQASTAKSTNDGLAELVSSIDNGRQFIKTGLGNFDSITGGLERKTVSILAARPSMGKTTLAWQIARQVALSGGRVLFLSLEVSGVSLWRKAALGLAEISSADLENRRISDEKIAYIRDEVIPNLRETYQDRLYIYDEPPFTPAALWKVTIQTAPDLVIIDHLDYVDDKTEKTVDRLGKVMKWGKRLAKKSNAHVMILHQLNRDVEKRDRKEPQLSDLRDSGNVEQDADVVLMPYRPAYYADSPVVMRYSETQLFIRKNRDNRLGTIGLYMDMLQQWFYRRDEIPANYSTIRLD